jgi:hypothetical protein
MPAAYKACKVIGVSWRHMGCFMKNAILTNALPAEGYIVELGGKFDSEYGTFMAAVKAGLELKNKYSQAQVKVYDANERTRSPAELSEPSETEAAS